MIQHTLGKTGLLVSPIGFGAAPIGYLSVEQTRVELLLNTLLDRELNLIDTAECYPGSEEAIGRAVSHRRGDYTLVTKCGHTAAGLDGAAWSADLITASIERSLRNLRTDRLDVVLLHTCDLPTLTRGEALGALIKARAAGKVRFIGYSGDNAVAAHAATLPDIAVLETSISIADQQNLTAVLPLAREHNLGVIAKRPIANAAWRPRAEQQGVYQDYTQDYADRLRAMNLQPIDLGFDGEPQMVWPEIALRFTLSHLGVHCAIVGLIGPDHIAANCAAALQGPLPEPVVQLIRRAFRDAETAAGKPWPGLA